MEMRAYLSDYVPYAQRILGDMLDFAVNTCDMDIDEYFELFTVSSVSIQFQNGNPTYIAGKTGCELVREVIATQEWSLFPLKMKCISINHRNIGPVGFGLLPMVYLPDFYQNS